MALTPEQLDEFDRCAMHVYAHVMKDLNVTEAGWFHHDPVFASSEFNTALNDLADEPEIIYVQVAKQLGYWPASCCELPAEVLAWG